MSGFALVLIAGLLQGSFVLPMALTRKWHWEHTWITFSVLGMLLFNWLIAAAIMPGLIQTFLSAPAGAVGVLVIFGLGWGVGAILFGLGMERLGMALGYPIIMGLIACLGALIPLVVFFPGQLLTLRGCLLLAGTGLTVLGVALCSLGGFGNNPSPWSGQSAGAKATEALPELCLSAFWREPYRASLTWALPLEVR